MVSFTTLLAFAAGAVHATPVTTQPPAIPSNWTWHVEGWSAGCARGGCYYDFNVSVPTIEGFTLGAKAYCSGSENGWYRKGNWYAPCRILEGTNSGISAKFSERTSDTSGSPEEILLSFEKLPYEPLNAPGYNYTGSHKAIYNQFVAPEQEFDVTPTTVTVIL
nr:CEP127 [Alternaria solani]